MELKKLIYMTAEAYILGLEGKGGDLMVCLSDQLLNLLQKPNNKINSADVSRLISKVVLAQQNGDTAYLADLLKYELLNLLGEK